MGEGGDHRRCEGRRLPRYVLYTGKIIVPTPNCICHGSSAYRLTFLARPQRHRPPPPPRMKRPYVPRTPRDAAHEGRGGISRIRTLIPTSRTSQRSISSLQRGRSGQRTALGKAILESANGSRGRHAQSRRRGGHCGRRRGPEASVSLARRSRGFTRPYHLACWGSTGPARSRTRAQAERKRCVLHLREIARMENKTSDQLLTGAPVQHK